MNIFAKTNIIVNNRYINKFLRTVPEALALKILEKIRASRRDKALINHKEAFSRKKESGNIVIVFVVYKPQLWNSLKTVYEAAVTNDQVDTYVVVSPDESRLGDGSILTSFDFYKEQCPGAINAVQDGSFFDVSMLYPDIIFRQSPYDNACPKEYSMANLARVAKTCYVPYSYNYTPNHLHIEYNDCLLANLYGLFSDCKTNYNYCVKEHNEYYPDLHVYYYGFPRFDIARRMQNKSDGKNVTFTWVPRWSTDAVDNDGTSFFEYKDLLPEYFSNHPELNLIIRPHPSMFSHFISLGLMTEHEVDKYFETIQSIPNIHMDDNMDYLKTFEETDVLIADMSSINYEFYLTGKPIIFCGDDTNYNAETKIMYELIYKVKNWGELQSEIEKLVNNQDPNHEVRLKDIDTAFNGLPDDIGKAVIEKCIEIVRG